MKNRLLWFIILPVLVSGCQSRSVEVAHRTIDADAHRFAEPFTWIGSIRELSDGRVIVADERERRIVMLSPDSQGGTAIAHQGSGPEEFRSAGTLIAVPGDTTMMFDLENNRLLVIDGRGQAVGTIAVPGIVGLGAEFRGADRLGRIYLHASGLPTPDQMDAGNHRLPDSSAVIRWDRAGGGSLDTVAMLAEPKAESGGSGNVMFFMIPPMTSRDDWGVTPDGSIGLIRVTPYRAEWRDSAGGKVVGPEQRYQKVPVTEADKKAWEEEQRNAPGFSISMGPAPGGGGGPAPAPSGDPGVPGGVPEIKWPDTKPPFMERAVVAGPGRRLWVLRTRAAADSIPVYDVFDARGELSERVSLPVGTRIVGFGKTTVYLIHTDEDGIQHLQRYRL